MLELRPAGDRGPTNFGWLDSRHTFSFGGYYDPRFMGFRDLLVINEDRVAPAAGFETHGHRDMEILSYVVSGALEHKDSLGNGSVIRPGEIQRMSAGTGIQHSEFNASDADPVHFLQIWIRPERPDLDPGYEQKHLPVVADGAPQLDLIASRDGGGDGVTVHQDTAVWRASLSARDQRLTMPLKSYRYAWVQAVRGSAVVNGIAMGDGDGLALSAESAVSIIARTGAELLIFDLG